MSTPSAPRKYFGNAGHFIASESCRFHLTTQIGDVVVSTVGDYYPTNAEGRKTIGYRRFFETMVFRTTGPCDCGCGMPEHDGSEVDFAGYQTRDEANVGHEAMCEKWAHGVAPAKPSEDTDADSR